MDEPGHKLLVSSEGAARQMEAALQMDARLHKLCTEASAAGDARLAESKAAARPADRRPGPPERAGVHGLPLVQTILQRRLEGACRIMQRAVHAAPCGVQPPEFPM